MAQDAKSWTLGEVAARLGGELGGPAAQPVSRPVPADSDEPEGITFAGSPRYLAKALASQVGAIIISPSLLPCAKPHIVVDDPRAAFGRLLSEWKRELPIEAGVHEWAAVSSEARIDPSASVGPFAVVERGAVVGPSCRVYSHAYIGENCILGEGCRVFPHAVLYQDVRLGQRVIVHAGAILGADGFGFEWDGAKQIKVPQIGSVEIGDDAEIGANSCVDRAMAGTTEIGQDVKLDNLVQIGHNSHVGDHTVVAAQAGISGSTTIGERVTMGGAVATSHHVEITDDVVLGGRTGVTSDIDEPGQYWGTPARPIKEAMRASLLVYRLPEMLQRIKELERRLRHPEED